MANNPTLRCNKAECTLSETGKCVLDNDPDSCPNRLASLEQQSGHLAEKLGQPVLEAPEEFVRFNGSYALGLEDAQTLFQAQYCTIVGILGAPGAGKTGCLVSLYLMLAHNRLAGFSFRNSNTIRAFEEISNGARRWRSTHPQTELTLHTELTDDRVAGFLHLRLKALASNACFDLLLPDLPGEWSNSLIDSNRADRLNFLKSCDVLWLVVNGQDIANTLTKFYTLHRLELLLERTADLLGSARPAVTLVVTRKDEVSTNLLDFTVFQEKADELGFKLRIVEIASFSKNDAIYPGEGLSELLSNLFVRNDQRETMYWPRTGNAWRLRQVLKFGKYHV